MMDYKKIFHIFAGVLNAFIMLAIGLGVFALYSKGVFSLFEFMVMELLIIICLEIRAK